MKIYEPQNIKNIVLLGHPSSGKTTLAETMMFEAGIIKRMGVIEEKNTVSDYHELEKLRGYSIFTSLLHTEWRDVKINILDTPGFDDFIGEVLCALRVSDTGLMLLNAHQGVEVFTEVIWRYAEQMKSPIIFIVNQVDHEKSDFDKTVEQAKSRLGSGVIPVQYPLNQGTGFDSIIDLLKMKMYQFPSHGGKPEKLPIPDSEKEKADKLHKQLVEAAAENDETLMEIYFEKGELNEDEMRKGIKAGMIHRTLFPLFCLSAKKNMGSGRLMGFIDNVVPSAAEMPIHFQPKSGTAIPCDPKSPASLFVFKTVHESNLGNMSYFEVYSGEIKTGMEMVNATNHTSERIGKIFVINGKERAEVSSLKAGDIGATVKLKNTHTNQTLHEKHHEVEYEPIHFPEHRIQVALFAKEKADEDRAVGALRHIHEEDPTLVIEQSRELRQTIVSGQGELHLTIAKWRLEHEHKLLIDFAKPRIPYRETIQKYAKGHFKHKKQSGGAGQYGEVYMLVEHFNEGMAPPKDMSVRGTETIDLAWGGKLVFNNCIVGGVIDQRFLPSILKGVMEKMEMGPLTGSYVRDVRVSVYDGSMHDVDSNDISFKIAGMKAFSLGFKEASPKILEPVYEVEIHLPEEVMGEMMGDLQTRRATILGMDSDGHYQIIKALVPLAELYKYSTSLRSISQGRAYFTMKFSNYTPLNSDLQEKLINEYKKVAELEEA